MHSRSGQLLFLGLTLGEGCRILAMYLRLFLNTTVKLLVKRSHNTAMDSSCGNTRSNRRYYLDPASTRMHIAQSIDPYSVMKNLGNHNKDYTRFFIRSTNQYVALCTHDFL